MGADVKNKYLDTDIMEVLSGMGEGTVALYCKGHVSPKIFFRAAQQYCDGRNDLTHCMLEKNVDNVNYEWWRTIPTKNGDIDAEFIRAIPGRRGAYPVTTIAFEDWVR